jgi:2Fe-2S ferredoxin
VLMVQVRFVRNSGDATELDIDSGTTVMEGAVRGGIEEIVADCGGALSCATCHVYVAPEWLDRVGLAQNDELAMLEFAMAPRDNSRLSCQITLDDSLDGLVLELPERQQ